MILKAFSVYDSKADVFGAPFLMKKQAEALRAWATVTEEKETAYSKHPADYTLFEMGEYDDNSGIFTSYEAKINLGTALEAKNKEL